MHFYSTYSNRHSYRTGLLVLSVAFTVLPAVSQTNRLAGIPDDSRRFRLQGHVHPLARAANDTGKVDASATISNVTLNFAPTAEQQAALDDLLARQQTPGAPEYHHWLTPEEFADRFGVSFSDLAAVKSWAEAQGLTVSSVARSRTWIGVSGTAAQMETAFRTELHRYLVNGETHFSNSTSPALPVQFSGLVRSVRGLNDFHARPRLHAAAKPRYTSSRGNHYVSPADLAAIYNFAPLYSAGIDGTGQKIAVAGQSQIQLSDVQHFRSEFGLAAKDPVVTLIPGSRDPGISRGDIDEAHLDIEWSGAAAANATIEYVYAYDVLNAVQYAIDQNIAPVISTSYGMCEGEVSAGEANTMRGWAKQANAQGITWFSASGDNGGADCAYIGSSALSVDMPGSIPEVTSVGGTEFSEGAGTYWAATNSNVSASATGYIPETSWNDSAQIGAPSATGGGASQFFAKPSWQDVPGVPGDTMRHVPDVALNASAEHDGYLVYSQAADVVFGGTSVPAPIFAGLAALLNQNAIKNGKQSSPGLGSLNPNLYALSQTAPSVFHDITTGDNIVTVTCTRQTNCTPGTVGFPAGPGYDQVTGLGSVDAYQFVAKWTGSVTPVIAPAHLALQSNVGSLTSNDSLIVTATATNTDGSTPVGVVTFAQGGTQLGTATLSGSGGTTAATLTVAASKLATGAGTITATWNGQTATLTVTVIGGAALGSAPGIAAVTNAASLTSAFAPGGIVSIFGAHLSPVTFTAPSVPLPLSNSGVSVTIGGIAAPIWYASPNQLNIQVPYEVTSGTSTTLVVNNNGQTTSSSIAITAAAPAIFTDTANGLAPSATGARGQAMTLYFTGAGQVTPTVATGAAPGPDADVSLLPAPRQATSVTVGGVPAPISFIGIPVGLVGVVQVNFTIPAGAASGSQPVVVTTGNFASKAARLVVQ
jgi:uncharacterized protein (TIGR03437 family)